MQNPVMQNTVISQAELPRSDNVVFRNSSFFRQNGRRANLPTPAVVRKVAGRETSEPWASKPFSVPFRKQGLVVKYGHNITTAEAQTLWVIRHKLGSQVPVPEVYGWCQDDKEVFIYMELVEGRTLHQDLSKLTKDDFSHIGDQLQQIVVAFRSLRQTPGEEFLGMLLWPISFVIRWLIN